MKAWNLRSIPLMIAVGFFGLGDSIFAQSELLTFDDLQAIGFPPVPNGYGGLGWQNFSYMDGVHFASPSGYNNGVVSPNIVAYGWGGLDYPSSLSGALFNLNSGYFTAAWNDGLQLQVQGFVGGILAYDNVFTLAPTSPTLINFNYLGVDQVTFTSYGGTPHPGYYSLDGGPMFALDNLNVAVIPEPSSVAIGTIGILIYSIRSWSLTSCRRQRR
jgi:hypothetical protein